MSSFFLLRDYSIFLYSWPISFIDGSLRRSYFKNEAEDPISEDDFWVPSDNDHAKFEKYKRNINICFS